MTNSDSEYHKSILIQHLKIWLICVPRPLRAFIGIIPRRFFIIFGKNVKQNFDVFWRFFNPQNAKCGTKLARNAKSEILVKGSNSGENRKMGKQFKTWPKMENLAKIEIQTRMDTRRTGNSDHFFPGGSG